MLDVMQGADPDFVKSISFNVLDAAHVATEGYDACMSGSVVHVPGLTNKLTAVFSRVLPKRMVRLVTGKMAH
jgi:short-subunit dehydrogenase